MLILELTNMKNAVVFIGRLATLILSAIFVEGFVTLGEAFKFENYSVMGWIMQTLAFFILLWATTEWHNSEEKK